MLLRIILTVVLSAALAGLALWKRALTRSGLITAGVFALIITFTAGVRGFLILAATFVFTLIAGKIKSGLREKREGQVVAKSGPRDHMQMICNILVGVIMLILYEITGRFAFCCAYGCAMAASLADSLASEIGVLSNKTPVDICTGKKITTGLSGGVTALGMGASALGAAIIALIFVLFGGGFRCFVIITVMGFLGALLDSILGSALQGKYRCAVCSIETEKKEHCGRPTVLTRGVARVNNDTVNFINNAFSGVVGMIIFLILKY
ncbi:MAG: DUF92 domain-containing protein [Oscillospiraceae bacterium]|nr:DUF92 domain-containing protein [Oscillospiraceae bacterium]